MPSPFDPELASQLLAKAGVKISAAELRARASPTSGGNGGGGGGGGGSSSSQRRGGGGGGDSGSVKQEYRGGDNDSNMGDMDMEDDPEDLTMGTGGGHNNNRYHHNQHMMDGGVGGGGGGVLGFSHPNTTITRVRHGGETPKSSHLMGADEKDGGQLMHQQSHMPPTGATGSSILDTYWQLIQENTFGE